MFQQEEQINSLSSQQAHLAAQLLSVRPAPITPLGPPKPEQLRPMALMGPMRTLELMVPMRPMRIMGPEGQTRPLEQLRPRTAPAALPGTNTHVLEYVHIHYYRLPINHLTDRHGIPLRGFMPYRARCQLRTSRISLLFGVIKTKTYLPP